MARMGEGGWHTFLPGGSTNRPEHKHWLFGPPLGDADPGSGTSRESYGFACSRCDRRPKIRRARWLKVMDAARLSGNGEFRILLTQILPNIMPIMVVQMSLTMGYAILNAAGLSFIGLGVRPPTPEWGIMVAEGAAFMVSGEWWIAFFPGLALVLAVFCFNLLGDGLRDIVDPQRRT